MQDNREIELIGVNAILTYEDDLVILRISQNEVEDKAKRLLKESYNMGLIIN